MAEYTLWGNTGGNNNADNASAVSLGTKIRTSATVPLWALGLRYYRGTLSAGTKTGRIFRTSDQSVVSPVVTFTDSGTGWQEIRFATPVALALNTLYTAAVLFPSGAPSFTGNYWTAGGGGAGGITNGPITAPNNADAPGQGVFTGGGTLVCPTSSFNSTCYWIDWIVTDVDPEGRQGTGATSAITTLTSVGSKGGRGTGALTVVGSLASAGLKAGTGAGSLAAAAELLEAGAKNGIGTAGTTASAAPASTGTTARTGNGALAANAGLTAAGQTHRTGTGALTATATLASVGHNPDNVHAARRFHASPPYTRGRAYPPRT